MSETMAEVEVAPSNPPPSRTLLLAAVALYLLGLAITALTSTHSIPAEVLRIAALTLAAIYGIRRRNMTVWILWSMFAGVELGLDAPSLALNLHVFSDIFLRLVKTIVAPLILGTLISGIAAHGSLKDVGRLGIKSLIYFEILTTIALLVGLAAINITRAGVGISLPTLEKRITITTIPAPGPFAASVQQPSQQSSPQQSAIPHWDQFLLHVFPENLAKSIAENEILQVVVFAVLFGLALTRLPEETRRPLLTVIQSFTKAMFQFTSLVMYLSPIAVGAALAYTIAHSGSGAILGLAKLVATLYAALLAFIFVGMLPAALLARVPIRRFLAAVAEPSFIAFSTATSEAALPISMENMETLGVPQNIVAFVIPTGYSFNLDGTAIYLALASIFVAQAAGIHLPWQTQLIMLATLVLTSKGVAGVPRASLVVLMATAASFHLPLEPIVLILGVDALMDMGRTSINVTGNCLASVVVARWEGKFGAPQQHI
jgi:proton glutamate symport protein